MQSQGVGLVVVILGRVLKNYQSLVKRVRFKLKDGVSCGELECDGGKGRVPCDHGVGGIHTHNLVLSISELRILNGEIHRLPLDDGEGGGCTRYDLWYLIDFKVHPEEVGSCVV